MTIGLRKSKGAPRSALYLQNSRVEVVDVAFGGELDLLCNEAVAAKASSVGA
jgi:hypothetical protein